MCQIVTIGMMNREMLEEISISAYPTGSPTEGRNLRQAHLHRHRLPEKRTVTAVTTTFAVEDAILVHRPRAAAEEGAAMNPRLDGVEELCTTLGAILAREIAMTFRRLTNTSRMRR